MLSAKRTPSGRGISSRNQALHQFGECLVGALLAVLFDFLTRGGVRSATPNMQMLEYELPV